MWVPDSAKDCWLAMDIKAHDIQTDQPAQYYQKCYIFQLRENRHGINSEAEKCPVSITQNKTGHKIS